MAKASDNPFPSLLLVDQVAAPGAPAAGQARLYRGDDGILYEIDDAGTPRALAYADQISGGGGGGSDLLAFVRASASATYATSSTTDADVDATNLSVTFTVPASGKVMVELSALVDSGTTIYEWTIRQGTTTVKACTMGSGYSRRGAQFYLTGLTPTASVTYKWGHKRVTSGTSTIYVNSGGANGDAFMRVTALP